MPGIIFPGERHSFLSAYSLEELHHFKDVQDFEKMDFASFRTVMSLSIQDGTMLPAPTNKEP